MPPSRCRVQIRPPRGGKCRGVGVDRARKICVDCPVIEQCLEYALDERIEHGVWGGCSERERRRILKRRRLAVSAD